MPRPPPRFYASSTCRADRSPCLALAAPERRGAPSPSGSSALGVPRGRALDGGAMQAFTGVARPPLEPSINGVAHLADPAPLLLGALLLVAVALLRRRPLMALLVPAILWRRERRRRSCSSPRSPTCG